MNTQFASNNLRKTLSFGVGSGEQHIDSTQSVRAIRFDRTVQPENIRFRTAKDNPLNLIVAISDEDTLCLRHFFTSSGRPDTHVPKFFLNNGTRINLKQRKATKLLLRH